MAKGKKGRKRSKKSMKAKGTTVGGHSYGGRKFHCYGKRVRSGKSKTKHPRIFCARDK